MRLGTRRPLRRLPRPVGPLDWDHFFQIAKMMIMKICSPNWDETEGVCTIHFIPQIPCPQCLAEEDTDVEVVLTDMDLDFVYAADLDTSDPDGIGGLFSPDQQWLVERIV